MKYLAARESELRRGYEAIDQKISASMFRRQCLLQLKRIATRCEGEVSRRGGKGLNKVQLIGYAGSDPEKNAEYQPTKFSLATTQYYTRDHKLESKTQWHRISVFKPQAQDTVNNYVRKGTRLFLEGYIDYNSWVDQEGVKRISAQIISDNVIILSQPITTEDPGY